jgi:hypothetical protein
VYSAKTARAALQRFSDAKVPLDEIAAEVAAGLGRIAASEKERHRISR